MISARLFILFHLPTDFNHLARKLAHVSKVFKIVRKNDYGERAKSVILAEVEVTHPAYALLDTNYSSTNALCLAVVIAGLLKRNTRSIGKGSQQ
jgi:hypothetical protein